MPVQQKDIFTAYFMQTLAFICPDYEPDEGGVWESFRLYHSPLFRPSKCGLIDCIAF